MTVEQRKPEHQARKYRKLEKGTFPSRKAKLVKVRWWNRLKRESPAIVAEMRAIEAPYKAWR
jgi:hypothetical protein